MTGRRTTGRCFLVEPAAARIAGVGWADRSIKPAGSLFNVNRLGPVVWLQTFLTEL
jgi:hypothetical protein